MSWAFTVPKGYTYGASGTTAADFDSDFQAAYEAFEAYLATQDETTTQAAIDQVNAAKAAAVALMASGAAGADGAQFSVYLNGHANPGHVGNDSVGATITQTAPPPTPTPASSTTSAPEPEFASAGNT